MNLDSQDTQHPTHLNQVTPRINTANDPFELNHKHTECVKSIQSIVNRGYSQKNGAELIDYIQRQRSVILEVMVSCFADRPTPAMADSMNTLIGQMEKSVRDERKEALKEKEMETSKETFELFRHALDNVISGGIKMPTFGQSSLELDPLGQGNNEAFEFKEGEFDMGVKVVDTKKIEAQLAEAQSSTEGSGKL